MTVAALSSRHPLVCSNARPVSVQFDSYIFSKSNFEAFFKLFVVLVW